MRVQQCWFAHLWCDPLDDAVLRITKALTRRSWHDREDDPVADLAARHPEADFKHFTRKIDPDHQGTSSVQTSGFLEECETAANMWTWDANCSRVP